ncbi:HD domain-containing protein [Desulfonatronum parangueonense]
MKQASSPPDDVETSQNHRLANFLFEVGMLRKTPRSGYQFLGSGQENVAEHSFRTTVIAYVLASLTEGADLLRTMGMALFHDLHETRIGDFNYVNRIYNSRKTLLAMEHALHGTGLDDIMQWWQELEATESLESRLVHDADQLDLILNLKQEQDLGNPYAAKWLECALPRLHTELARDLAAVIMRTDHTDWWFKGPDPSWWRKGHNPDSCEGTEQVSCVPKPH